MTLIEWYNPLTWSTDQGANLINFFSAIGTVGALAYAFYLERKNSKKINDLAVIAEKLTEQNQLLLEQNLLQKQVMKGEAAPNLIATNGGYNGTIGNAHFNITNNGQKAIVSDVEYLENDVTFVKLETPFTIERNGMIELQYQNKNDLHILNCNWQIKMWYQDLYGHRYNTTICGTAGNVKEVSKEVL